MTNIFKYEFLKQKKVLIKRGGEYGYTLRYIIKQIKDFNNRSGLEEVNSKEVLESGVTCIKLKHYNHCNLNKAQ